MQETNTPGMRKDLGWLFRASRMLKFLFLLLLVTLGIATAVGLSTLAQLAAGKGEVAKLRAEISAMKERVSRLEKGVAQFSASNPSNPKIINAQSVPPATTALSLTNDEVSLIRYFIKLPPPPPGATPSIAIGDLLPEARLMPLPESISEKLPKLRGARFTTDRNQAIVIVDSKNRAEAIVGPN
jgi:cell division protein FtsB